MTAREHRYAVVFTPVGWQVVDTIESCDPIAEFGTGDEEYKRAKEAAEAENISAETDWHASDGSDPLYGDRDGGYA